MSFEYEPWWFNRWFASEAYAEMNMEQQGIYRNLLSRLWQPGFEGILPSDPERLRKLAKATEEEWSRSWPVVKRWFIDTGRGFINDKQATEMRESKKRRRVKSAAGRIGGNARAAKALHAKQTSSRRQAGCLDSASSKRQAKSSSPSPSPSPSPTPSNGLRTTEAPPSAPPPEPPPTPATEAEARTKARKVLGADALPPRWNQEFADDFRAVYRVKFVPNQFFRQVQDVAEACGWDATRPALRQYMRETPVDLLAIPKALRVRIEQAQNGGPPPRAGPAKTVGEKTLGALERFVARGGELDRPSDVREGPRQAVKRLPPGS